MSGWDAQAATLDGARRAVWSEDDCDYDARAAECLFHVTHALPDGPGRIVLDLGCGIGRLAIPLARQRPDQHVVGFDTSAAMLGWARAEAGDLSNVTFVHGDGRGPLPPCHAAFSVVTFQHLPPGEIARHLSALWSALPPGGRFRFQFVRGDHHDVAAHDHRYEMAEMRDACRVFGYTVESIEEGVMYPEWVWMTLRRP